MINDELICVVAMSQTYTIFPESLITEICFN